MRHSLPSKPSVSSTKNANGMSATGNKEAALRIGTRRN
jgi:hypothetical protein